MKLNLIIVILSRCGCDISWEVRILITYYMLPVKKTYFYDSSWISDDHKYKLVLVPQRENDVLTTYISVAFSWGSATVVGGTWSRRGSLLKLGLQPRTNTSARCTYLTHHLSLRSQQGLHSSDLQSSLNSGKITRQRLSKLNCTRIRNYLRFIYEN